MLKIYKEIENVSQEKFLRLINQNGITYLVFVDKNGDVIDKHYVASITEDGLRLSEGLSLDCGLAICPIRSTVAVTI